MGAEGQRLVPGGVEKHHVFWILTSTPQGWCQGWQVEVSRLASRLAGVEVPPLCHAVQPNTLAMPRPTVQGAREATLFCPPGEGPEREAGPAPHCVEAVLLRVDVLTETLCTEICREFAALVSWWPGLLFLFWVSLSKAVVPCP